jgi:hypothetical protein
LTFKQIQKQIQKKCKKKKNIKNHYYILKLFSTFFVARKLGR